MAKRKAVVKDTDPAFRKLLTRFGEMGQITIGIHPDETNKPHPSGYTIGEIAEKHELGLGVPRRSWLLDYLDETKRSRAALMREAMKRVIAGKQSRKQAMEGLGYKAAKGIRDRIAQGRVKPANAASTVRKKKTDVPLVETYTLHNHITYKVFLPQAKSIKNPVQRALVGKRK